MMALRRMVFCLVLLLSMVGAEQSSKAEVIMENKFICENNQQGNLECTEYTFSDKRNEKFLSSTELAESKEQDESEEK